jgi:protein SCO1/2
MSRPRILVTNLILAFSLGLAPAARADLREPINTAMVPADQLPRNIAQVGVDQKLGARIPPDLEFTDERGRPVRLGELLRERPTVLTLAYFRCPSLCSVVLTGVADGLKGAAPLLGREYQALTVSIDPRESPRLALAKKRSYLARYGRIGVADATPAWRFLTGRPEAIRRLADAVGFRYTYDARTREFAHASVAMVVTPDGRMSQYLFGVRFAPADFERAIAQAARSGIGSPLDQLLLYCFHYDGTTGRWSLRIQNTLHVLAALTVLGLLAAWWALTRKERAA